MGRPPFPLHLVVAPQAGAYRVILTHFSTRYPTMPAVDVSAHPHMSVACDFMSVNLADLAWLPRLTPCLEELFKREQAGWELEEEGGGGGDGGVSGRKGEAESKAAAKGKQAGKKLTPLPAAAK